LDAHFRRDSHDDQRLDTLCCQEKLQICPIKSALNSRIDSEVGGGCGANSSSLGLTSSVPCPACR
jgi:hypothetical protein